METTILDFDETQHLAILLKDLKEEDSFLVLTLLERASFWKGYAEGQELVREAKP